MGVITMAGRGPAPKDPKTRRRRNADPVARTELVADGRTRGPALPKDALPTGETWHPRTQAWWASWRKSAQAQTFTPLDWDFLLDTALMHHTMWSKGRWEFASEVRLRSAKYGATPEDRARLRMEVSSGPARPPAPAAAGAVGSVTDIASRRARLTG
jgi:hypothetical protein